jgi:hypothetical protein
LSACLCLSSASRGRAPALRLTTLILWVIFRARRRLNHIFIGAFYPLSSLLFRVILSRTWIIFSVAHIAFSTASSQAALSQSSRNSNQFAGGASRGSPFALKWVRKASTLPEVSSLFFQGANEDPYLTDTGRESNAEKQPTGSGPEGCDENGPAAALLVGHVPHQFYASAIWLA